MVSFVGWRGVLRRVAWCASSGGVVCLAGGVVCFVGGTVYTLLWRESREFDRLTPRAVMRSKSIPDGLQVWIQRWAHSHAD
ncbi:MAG: hypothetical protein COW42_00455, partial [Deltaproteobacteria bacterium CG17_big_fil_post_rev_8_21_14_2_50_63_7]